MATGERTCAACGSPLDPPAGSRGFAFCARCGTPTLYGDRASPFDVFGVPARFALDEGDLRARFYELSRRLHPDRFAGARSGAEKAAALELSALLNASYLALKTPEDRLETLLGIAGALDRARSEAQTQAKAQIPAELAEEYFELQEALMEDEATASKAAADFRARLEESLASRSKELFALAAGVDWSLPQMEPSRAAIEKILELRRQR